MICANDLAKNFDKFKALDKITCTVPDGCVYGLVGSNGAGKSTFLRTISGVYKPDGGTVTVDGQEIWNNPVVKSKILYVPDELYFINGSNMNRMRDMYKTLYKSFDEQRYNELTLKFGLNTKLPLSSFSKGMKRQTAIILALSCRPQYMFFDETFDGLDPVMRNYVKTLICEDTINNNTTAIVTSHSLRELEDLCDQLALLHKGGLVLENDVEHLKTSQFKIQVAFTHSFNKSDFDGINITHFAKHGSVANMIVKGDREETVKRIKSMEPQILDVLPLSLEEVFTYEMETLGYTFNIDQEGIK